MPDQPINRTLIIGAGWTGRQIAAQCAAFGIETVLVDSNDATTKDAVQWCHSHVDQLCSNGTWAEAQATSLRNNLTSVSVSEMNAKPLCDSFDLAIENVPEQASIKRKVLKHYSSLLPASTIIASNSSYFLPSQLSKYVTAPQRFAHLHFHVPVCETELVDIIGGPECSPDVIASLEKFAQRIHQKAIIQLIENPGYIFNWMLQSLLSSSLELLDRKVATPEQIDLAWTQVTKMPIGPIGIVDRIGLDVVYQVLQNAQWSSGDPKISRLMTLLQPYIDQGYLGWKTGRGFYDYRCDNKPE